MQTQSATRITAIAALIATAGLAVASNETPYVPGPAADPLVQSTAALSGQYSATIGSEVVYGSGGFNATVSIPVILDRSDVLLNAPTAWNSPFGAAGFITTYGNGSNDTGQGVVLSFNSAGNAVIINEGVNTTSNSAGQILEDGTWLFRSNFNGTFGPTVPPTQNNIEVFRNAANALPGSGIKPSTQGTAVFSNTVIGSASGTRITIPTGISRPGGFFLGQSNFTPSGSIGALSGINVWNVSVPSELGSVDVSTSDFVWEQAAGPVPTSAGGQSPSALSHARFTNPQFFAIDGCPNPFVIWGVGYTGSSSHPYSGGAFGSLYFVVDNLDPNDSFFGWSNYGILKADGGNSLNPTSNEQRFVTTGASGNFVSPRFDVNSSGQLVVVHEDFSTSGGATYQVRLYNPVFDGCTVTYPDFEVIASTGVVYDDGTEFTPFVDTFLNTEDPDNPIVEQSANNTPFSGVSIDDEGNISFTATDGLFFEERVIDPVNYPELTAQVVFASTTSLYHYHAASQSLHRIVSGGQNGSILSSTGNPDLQIGRFPVDNNDSDSFGAFSANNGVAAINFRNGFDDARILNPPASGNVQNGGQLNPGTTSRQGVRGVVLVDLGDYDPNFGGGPNCIGDADGSGLVNLDDLNLVLTNFGASVDPGTSGDVDDNGVVNLDDLNIVLTNFGQCNEE